jgi:hypothetical protein
VILPATTSTPCRTGNLIPENGKIPTPFNHPESPFLHSAINPAASIYVHLYSSELHDLSDRWSLRTVYGVVAHGHMDRL